MNILETIIQAQGGSLVRQLAGALDVDERSIQNAIGQVVPALSRGIQRNAATETGFSGLADALAKGNHQRYLEQPETLAEPAAQLEGNAILGHVFGSKDVSRNVAGAAAKETGIDAGIIKKLLPLLAPVVMGALSSRASSSELSTSQGEITSFLDFDKDGSAIDDILDMARRFF